MAILNEQIAVCQSLGEFAKDCAMQCHTTVDPYISTLTKLIICLTALVIGLSIILILKVKKK